jgi:hypothetical protein
MSNSRVKSGSGETGGKRKRGHALTLVIKDVVDRNVGTRGLGQAFAKERVACRADATELAGM